jgi:perosamine synthetase
LSTGWISGAGPHIQRFERAIAGYVGTRYAAAVANGTVALHVALVALGVREGDEVIVPTFAYVAVANAVTQAGATPVFVDCDESRWTLDPGAMARAITPRTRAVIVVHQYGQPADLDAIVSLARTHGLFVIEDCAEALGARVHGQHVGTMGDVATFSFYGNKTITTGEGGMVVTNDFALHDRVQRLRGQGLARHREYWHDVVAYNYRMTNISAALGLAQFERLERFVARKRAIAERYASLCAALPVTLHAEAPGTTHAFWMCSVLVPEPDTRDEVRARMAAAGVETRPTFYPIHTMPMYAARYARHPVSEAIAARGINLPSYPGLTDDDVASVVDALAGAMGLGTPAARVA